MDLVTFNMKSIENAGKTHINYLYRKVKFIQFACISVNIGLVSGKTCYQGSLCSTEITPEYPIDLSERSTDF